MGNTEHLVKHLITLPHETPWLEFKQNLTDAEEIGEYISALGNSAACEDKERGYLVWGIHDESHDIVGTEFNPFTHKVGNEELENWLHHLLSSNAVFEFEMDEIEGRNVVVMTVQKALQMPVTFKKRAFIRSGTYKKPLQDIPPLEIRLWAKLNSAAYERGHAKENLTLAEVLSVLDYTSYFDLTHIPLPTSPEEIVHYLTEDALVEVQDDGRYAVTNAGAVLFAKKLSGFRNVSRKALRIIQYEGTSRLRAKSEREIDRGYASSFEEMMRYLTGILPQAEVLENGVRVQKAAYPEVVLREIVANALIHQDFIPSGTGPMVEIFENRIEVTNPEKPLIDIMRIVDNPPRSRNELLASLMRRAGFCEERGSGWDRVAAAAEEGLLPAPRITAYEDATKVIVSMSVPLEKLPSDDKIWSCYLHSCIKYANDEMMTNASLRERFAVPPSGKAAISRLIKATVDAGLIKPFDEKTAPRYMQYIPIWA